MNYPGIVDQTIEAMKLTKEKTLEDIVCETLEVMKEMEARICALEDREDAAANAARNAANEDDE